MVKLIVEQEGFAVYDMSDLTTTELHNIIADHIGAPEERLTDMAEHYDHPTPDVSTEYTNPVPAVVPPAPPKDAWDHPVLNTFKNAFGDMASAVVERTKLAERVAMLEKEVEEFKTSTVNLINERDSLKAENGNLNDQVRILKDEVERKEGNLEYTRQNLARSMRARDDLQTQYDDVTRQLATAKDDVELAHMERDDWAAKHNKEKADHEYTKETAEENRKAWYDQEEKLATKIDELTVKKDKLEHKWSRCKSFAAEIMQLARDE